VNGKLGTPAAGTHPRHTKRTNFGGVDAFAVRYLLSVHKLSTAGTGFRPSAALAIKEIR
jgi:hypothetical protein